MSKTVKFKKVFSLILAVITVISALPAAFAADISEETVILYTNDVHCAINGYPLLAAYRAQLIDDGKNVITVDAGDAIQGEIIGTKTKGSAIVDIMNAVGYDYAVPGNHEFDYGTDTFLELANTEAQYEYTSSNFVDLREDKSVFEPYYIKEMSGVKIAFIGITSPETFTKSTPEYFKDENGNYIYGFSENEIYETVQSSADLAIAHGADVVVALSHLGIDGVQDGWRSTDVIANTSGIDVFIDAHSHETIASETYKNKNDEDVILTSGGTKFENFGQITVSADRSVEATLIDTDSVKAEAMSGYAQGEYAAVKQKVDAYNAEIAYLYDEIGISETDLVVYDDNGNWLVRSAETNMGNFVADAYVAGIEDAEVALVNAGGIRAEIKAGSVSRMDLMNINPWNNEMCVIKATGQQIADALEHGAKDYPDSSGGFLQTSEGLTYEIHEWVESPVIVDDKGSFAGIEENKPRRVRNIKINGNPIDPEKEYAVAGTVYLLTQGGDGFTMFSSDGMKTVSSTDAELLIKYFTETLGGKITAEKYENPSGRITVYETNNCTHICHGDGFLGFVWTVINFFCKLFGIHSVCACGEMHY